MEEEFLHPELGARSRVPDRPSRAGAVFDSERGESAHALRAQWRDSANVRGLPRSPR